MYHSAQVPQKKALCPDLLAFADGMEDRSVWGAGRGAENCSDPSG